MAELLYSDGRVKNAYSNLYGVDYFNEPIQNTCKFPIFSSSWFQSRRFSESNFVYGDPLVDAFTSAQIEQIATTIPYFFTSTDIFRRIHFGIPVYESEDSDEIKYWIDAFYRRTVSGRASSVGFNIEDYAGSHVESGSISMSGNVPAGGILGIQTIYEKYNGKTYIGMIGLFFTEVNPLTVSPIDSFIVLAQLDAIEERLARLLPNGYYIKTVEAFDEYGPKSEEGGYSGGTFDDSSDVIALPTAPTLGVSSAGFVNIYNPTAGALQGLGSELFPDLNFTPDSPISGTGGVTEAIEAMATALVNFGNQIPNLANMYINSNLINYVIDCHIIPVRPLTAGAQAIKIGFKTFNPTAAVVNSDYVDFDCGTLEIGEYYANFIDYAPYTKAKLFLPFVGFVDLAPEYFQGGRLNVTYRFNIIDGSFMAFVRSTSSKSNLSDSVVMQFGGNACVHIPLTGLNYSSMVSGVVSGAAAVMSSQSGVQAATSAVNSAVDVANSKPPLQQSNGYNATTSFLGVRVPYLLIERSASNFSTSYTDEEGLPSNISTAFSALSGFTQASAVHLDGIDGATSEELEEIRRLLAEGVIF